MKKITLLCWLLLTWCNTTVFSQSAKNKFSDHKLRHIYDLQDRRHTDSLLTYLDSTDPTYRQAAALAFASVQDTAAVSRLIELLSDPNPRVRTAAAYALGQTGHVKAQRPLIYALETDTSAQVRSEIAEALGKCADMGGVEFLSAMKFKDPLVIYGQVAGLYRAALRKLVTRQGNERILACLSPGLPVDIRMMAASYLSRHPKKDFVPYQETLIAVLRNDPEPYVRMNVAAGLGSTIDPLVLDALKQTLKTDKNHLVRINAIKALNRFDTAATQPVVAESLDDENINVAITAADFLLAHVRTSDALDYPALAGKAKSYRVRGALLAAAVRNEKKNEASKVTQKQYAQSMNVYEKGALLKALSENPANFRFLHRQFKSIKQPPLNTFALEALLNLRNHPKFSTIKKGEATFGEILKQSITGKDAAQMALAAGELRNPEHNYKAYFASYEFIKTAKAALPLPLEIETFIELQKTIDFFEGKDVKATPTPAFNHPVDWNFVAGINKYQQVKVKTSRGEFTMQLFVEDAPATVANFVKLVEEGFYTGKIFHRVVPNFVVQTGCPRGDGYGNIPYSLRSELAPLTYSTGMVGMASAGKDTEGSQWFVTHSPTPHLDGRYTIFAEVTEGMATIQLIEVGDRIEKVELVGR